MFPDEFEEDIHVLSGPVRKRGGPALLCRGKESWEIELLVACVKSREEVEHLLLDLQGTLVRFVDLVDDDDRTQAEGRRLGEHENTVAHAENPLDLVAEIGVARSVDDGDLRAVPGDRRAFGRDGVMPRSRSMSLETRVLSAPRWLSRNVPDRRKSTSTKFVLP